MDNIRRSKAQFKAERSKFQALEGRPQMMALWDLVDLFGRVSGGMHQYVYLPPVLWNACECVYMCTSQILYRTFGRIHVRVYAHAPAKASNTHSPLYS